MTGKDKPGQESSDNKILPNDREHGQGDQVLIESDYLLRSVVRNAPLVLWVLDSDGVFIFSDGKGLEALGLQPGEVVGKSVFDLYGDVPQIMDDIRRGLSGVRFASELETDGRVYQSQYSPQFNEQGQVTRLIGVSVDVTESRHAGKALQEYKDRYRELVDEAASIILRWKTDGSVTFFNEFAQQFFGYREDEILGRNVVGTIVPEKEMTGRDLALLMQEIQRDPGKFEYNENENIKRNGERVWIAWKNKPVFDEQGNLVEVLSVGIDITQRHQAEQQLRRSEQELSTILDSLQDTFYRTDVEGHVIMASRSVSDLLGYTPGEILGTKLASLYVDPQGRDEFVAALQANGGAVKSYEAALRHRNGSVVWVSTSAHYYLDSSEKIAGVEGVVRDITEQRNAAEHMRQLSSALEQAADSVVITDRDGIISYVNPAFETTTGYSRDEAIGRKSSLTRSDRHDTSFYDLLWSTILAGKVFSDVLINKKKNGDLYYEQKTITPLKNAHGDITHFISTGKDISESMQTQERLKYLAHHDVLTGLPNRTLFMDRLGHALARTRDAHAVVAVLFLDLDHFKIINDTMGHAAGDHTLKVVSERLQASVREGDTVARLGGDEFAIILEDIETEDNIAPIAIKVLEALSRKYELQSQEFYMTGSIGISLFPTDGKDADTLLKHADIAMYRAKDQGRNSYQFYLEDMSAKALQRLNLETSLRHALERDEFVLHYQPQIDVETGRIAGMEALLRWHHPDLGIIGPRDFIPILEETGLIVPVGDWVLRTACAQAVRWHMEKGSELRMAVNLSSRQFSNAGLKDSVASALEETGLDPHLLEIEMTESAIIHHTTATMDTFLGLGALGVRLALDDFGTGYSSLSYLKRYPVHVIKIDRSFIRDIVTDPDDAAIVQAIIAMARRLDLLVVGEGVETVEQLEFLRKEGCPVVQGNYLGRPAPAKEAGILLD